MGGTGASGSSPHDVELTTRALPEIFHGGACVLNGCANQRVEEAVVAHVTRVHVLTLLEVATGVAPDDVRHVDEAMARPIAETIGPQYRGLIAEPTSLEMVESGGERLHAQSVDFGVRLGRERVTAAGRITLNAVLNV